MLVKKSHVSFFHPTTGRKYYFDKDRIYKHGGTADVLRHELSTGDLYSKNGHIQKAIEAKISLKRLINSGNLNHQDFSIATSLRQELHKALSEQEWDKIYINRQTMRSQ